MKSVCLTIFCSSRIVANKGAYRHVWNVRSFAQMCARLRKCALVVRPGLGQYQSYKPCVIFEMRSFQKFLLVVHVYVRLGKNLHKTANNQKWMLVVRCRSICLILIDLMQKKKNHTLHQLILDSWGCFYQSNKSIQKCVFFGASRNLEAMIWITPNQQDSWACPY